MYYQKKIELMCKMVQIPTPKLITLSTYWLIVCILWKS